ncbi:thioredoxin family protein [Verrucomicrobiales bacterium]|nr:thioredoxin family protein [Verrucomicrobiales bacterium]
MKLLSTVLTSAVLLVSLQAEVQKKGAEIGKWTQDYDAALKVAAEKKVPIMLNFTGSDWCHWCKIMDEKVFAEDEWKTYAAENAVLVTLDFPKDKSGVPEGFAERNAKLQAEFGVRGYPTFVVLDSDGKTPLGQLGASQDASPAGFIKQFKGATQLSAANVDAFLKENPAKEADLTAAIKESKDSKEALNEWISTGPQQTEENNKKFAAFQKRIASAEETLVKLMEPKKSE